MGGCAGGFSVVTVDGCTGGEAGWVGHGDTPMRRKSSRKRGAVLRESKGVAV